MNHQQINSFETFMTQISDKLIKTVAALESDEVIEQMRNDKTLYKFKLNHISEIIEEHFTFTHELTQLLNQNQSLSENLAALEQKLEKKDQQFAQAIDLIEQSAKKHTHLKELQIAELNTVIKEFQTKLNGQTDAGDKYSKKIYELNQTVQSLEQANEKLRKQLSKFKEQNIRLGESSKKLQISLKEAEVDHERSINLLRTQNQKQIHECQNLVKKMQNDMLTIKSQWQKKCVDLEKGLKQFYEGQLIKLEEKKTRELIQHFETIKEGKPIIIKQDQEIFNSKVEFIRRQYEVEIQKIQKSKDQLQQIYQNFQNSQIHKMKQSEIISDELKGLRTQYQSEKDYWTSQKEKLKRQNEKLKAIVLQIERNSKDLQLQLQAKQTEVVKLQDNVKFIEKKLEIVNRNIGQQKTLMLAKDEELEILKSKYIHAEEEIKKNMKNLENIEGQLQAKTKKIQKLCRQVEIQNEKIAELSETESLLKAQIKILKSQKIKYRKIFDKLCIQIKNCQKEQLLLKQDIKYTHQLHRKRIFGDLQKINDKAQAYRESVQRESKTRMNDLVNEIQEAKQAEQIQFQNLIRERDSLKRQLAELQELFEKKEMEVEETKKSIINSQADAVRKSMTQQLQKQKKRYEKLQKVLENTQNQFHRRLSVAKSEVKEAVRVLTNKWMEEMGKLEEENRKKEVELHRIVEKIQVVIGESEEIKRSYENQREQTKRLRKKYENLKQEKDEQIADFIKKIQKESKHKITLEKELRSIRSELNRGTRQEKYLETENKNMGNSVTDRQKELTQIRQLIAKTYQAVGEKPEKDTKYQRQRSPF